MARASQRLGRMLLRVDYDGFSGYLAAAMLSRETNQVSKPDASLGRTWVMVQRNPSPLRSEWANSPSAWAGSPPVPAIAARSCGRVIGAQAPMVELPTPEGPAGHPSFGGAAKAAVAVPNVRTPTSKKLLGRDLMGLGTSNLGAGRVRQWLSASPAAMTMGPHVVAPRVVLL